MSPKENDMHTDQTPGSDQSSGQAQLLSASAPDSSRRKDKGSRTDGGTPSRPPKVLVVVEVRFDDEEEP